MESSRWLWIVRHGQAANSYSLPDFERPLTQRGREDALVVGQNMLSTTGELEYVVASSAPRALATAILIAGTSADVVEEQTHLYMASTETLLTAVRAIAGDIRCAAIVGHNPGISDLANLLTRKKEYRLAPLEALCLDVTTPWIDLGSSPLRVTRFVEPNKAKP